MAIAVIAILSAFSTKEKKDFVNIKVRGIIQAGSPLRYYVYDANTSNAVWDKQLVTGTVGIDYLCVSPQNLCTVTIAATAIPAYDATLGGYYFTSSQVVSSEAGTFVQ